VEYWYLSSSWTLVERLIKLLRVRAVRSWLFEFWFFKISVEYWYLSSSWTLVERLIKLLRVRATY
jgi:hypothetical protein